MSSQNFPRIRIVVDPWNLKGTIERLKRHCRIEEFTFTSSNVEKMSRNLYYFVHNGLVRFFPHNELEKELLSLNLEQKSYGYRFDHPSSQFSDHAIALSIALMQVAEVKKPTSGIIFTESPSFEEFEEEWAKGEKADPNIVKREAKKEDTGGYKENHKKFLTLTELENWRKLIKM